MSETAIKMGRMPAKIDPDESTYRGKFAARLYELRAGRDVEKIVKEIRKRWTRVSIGTYYNWEGGKTDPPIAALPAIAKALGAKSVGELFPNS